MGYTHYWTQTRDYTREEWSQIREDMEALLKDVQHVQGIWLANGMGDRSSAPEITDKWVMFNGVGADGHETLVRRILLLHVADVCNRIRCGPPPAPSPTGMQALTLR